MGTDNNDGVMVPTETLERLLAYADEVLSLRLRVALLEKDLAELRAAQPGAVAVGNNSDCAFAQAWNVDVSEDQSFEELIAERAFFQASSVDEPSRSWLLAM